MTGKKKQAFLASFKLTTHHMMEMKASLQDQLNVLFTSKKLLKKLKLTMKKLVSQWITRPTSIADIAAGYIDKENEVIFGIQNDEFFKLNFMPKGGIRMAETTLKENGYEPDPAVHEIFTKYVTTVNDGIFRAYTSNIRRARHAHTVTGLPDAYSRGRIIGVYARLALYGADYLMQEKVNDWNAIEEIDEETIRLREEVNLQYQALQEVVRLG